MVEKTGLTLISTLTVRNILGRTPISTTYNRMLRVCSSILLLELSRFAVKKVFLCVNYVLVFPSLDSRITELRKVCATMWPRICGLIDTVPAQGTWVNE